MSNPTGDALTAEQLVSHLRQHGTDWEVDADANDEDLRSEGFMARDSVRAADLIESQARRIAELEKECESHARARASLYHMATHASPPPAETPGEGPIIGRKILLLKDIVDDGEDHHPAAVLARKGETVVVRMVRWLMASHEGVDDRSFVVHTGEFEFVEAASPPPVTQLTEAQVELLQWYRWFNMSHPHVAYPVPLKAVGEAIAIEHRLGVETGGSRGE